MSTGRKYTQEEAAEVMAEAARVAEKWNLFTPAKLTPDFLAHLSGESETSDDGRGE